MKLNEYVENVKQKKNGQRKNFKLVFNDERIEYGWVKH